MHSGREGETDRHTDDIMMAIDRLRVIKPDENIWELSQQDFPKMSKHWKDKLAYSPVITEELLVLYIL